jgi:hypothetical protein
MYVSTGKKHFDIWNLFVHDHDQANVAPFDDQALAKHLNDMAALSYPDAFFQMNPPSGNGLSQWNVWFAPDRYKTLSDGMPDFDVYPKRHISGRDEMVKAIPEQLTVILEQLNGQDFLV